MWSTILLCVLVGSAYSTNSSPNPAWRDNTKYEYHIRARTLSSLDELSDNYAGMILKGKLTVEPKGENLYATIRDVVSSPEHTTLTKWDAHIPEDNLSYKPIQWSEKPFQIVMRDGVVRDLIVSKDVPNWEANMIKGIVSQIQLDTKGANIINRKNNAPPRETEKTNQYTTMEDTVTGVFETTYIVDEFPEWTLQSNPELVPLPHLKGNGKIMEVVKSKNHSNAEERPMYHYGWKGLRNIKPGSNQVGEIFSRSSVSHAVISGNYNRYTIQSSHTVNKVAVSPTLYDKQRGSVVSMVQLTLASVQSNQNQPPQIHDPISLGSLVYAYNRPSSDGKSQPGHSYGHELSRLIDPYRHTDPSVRIGHLRSTRDVNNIWRENYDDAESKYESLESLQDSGEHNHEQEIDLESAPESPLLPLTMGYMGVSIKSAGRINVAEKAKSIANEIAEEMKNPEEMPSKDTLSKFVILASLTRSMSREEIQNVATSLYHTDNQGRRSGAWEVFRDAVAESGTGPALTAISNWILNKQLDNYEAADVISTLAGAVRQPTEQYMRKFYELVKKPEVQEQSILNDTALLSFTNLAYKVYVNKQESHNMYPVHSFGKFETDEGKAFLRYEVIPWLEQRLQEAISRADSVKIQVYIRALGNIGDQKILEVLEPYLEGEKQVSQFQRVMMVIALDNLARAHPDFASSVLFKIYLNRGDKQEVRVAAVHQIIRTSPPAEMLQHMAMMTNLDTSEQVNSVVKSAIESASEMEGDEFVNLRAAARAAKPFLTKKEYGIQYSKYYLSSYVTGEMQTIFKESISSLADGTLYLPKGFKYGLRAYVGQYTEYRFLIEGLVSSVEELIHVSQRQTKEHREEETKAQQDQESSSFSSQIARLLGMQVKEREQLEGNIHLKLGDFHRFLAYNNQTIEMAPRIIREWEENLKSRKSLRYHKIINEQEKALAYPTEMGVPFLYTYDVPTMVTVHSNIKASANPPISNGQQLSYPEKVDADWEIRATYARKVQGKFGFITPFDSYYYSAGYDKNLQIHLPVRGKLSADIKQKHFEMELEPLEPNRNINIFHYSSWPYTAASDMQQLKPESQRPSTQIIKKQTQRHKKEFEWGQGAPLMVFRADVASDEPLNMAHLYRKFYHQDFIAALMSYGLNENIQQTNVNVHYAGSASRSQKVSIRLGYKQKYQAQPQPEANANDPYNEIKEMHSSGETQSRQQDFINKASAGIHNAHAQVVDASVEFSGQENIKYLATAAFASSHVDPKSRVLVYYQGYSDDQPKEFRLSVKSHFPNTNYLDPEYAITFDPTSTAEVQMSIGESFESSAKYNATAKWKKTNSRMDYLKSTDEYHQCREEMAMGNKNLPACANITDEANLMDDVQIQMHFEQVIPEVLNYAHKAKSALEYMYYYQLDENIAEPQRDIVELQAEIEARYSPDFKYLNVAVKTPGSEIKTNEVEIGDWAKRVHAVHPAVNVQSRLMGKALGLKTYRPICVMDKTTAVTFDDLSYPLSLEKPNARYLMFQYIKSQARRDPNAQQPESVPEQLKHQIEKYQVFVRKSSQNAQKKEVNIFVSSPKTQFKLTGIKLQPSAQSSGFSVSHPKGKVSVNGRDFPINDQQSTDIQDGAIQIYALPNGEVKVDVHGAFYVVYDGTRVQVAAINDKLRSSIRGLCGNFNGEKWDDMQAPKGCILSDAKEFEAAYEIEEGAQNPDRQSQARIYSSDKCREKRVYYANVVSDIEAGRARNYPRASQRESTNTIRKTVYEVEDGSICFSIRPLDTCKRGYQPAASHSREIPVHCVAKSNIATLWKNQIDEGTVVDFSRKTATKSIRMTVPTHCTD